MIKLRTVQCDSLGLSRLVLNAVTGEVEGDVRCRRGEARRPWRQPPSQGTPAAARSWKGREGCSRCPVGGTALPRPRHQPSDTDLQLLAPSAGRERINVCCSTPPVGGNLLWQPQETDVASGAISHSTWISPNSGAGAGQAARSSPSPRKASLPPCSESGSLPVGSSGLGMVWTVGERVRVGRRGKGRVCTRM